MSAKTVAKAHSDRSVATWDASMVDIDQPIEVDGVYTTIRTLAAEGRITRWHSLSFNAPGATEPYEGWFADCVADGTEWWEISEADFDELAGLGVPMKQSR